MSTGSSMEFLNRKKLINGRRRRPRFMMDSLQSHRRPTKALPVLLPPDDVADRIETQKTEDRIPYQEP